MRVVYFIALCIIIVSILFSIFNPETVTVHYYFGDKTVRLSVFSIIAFLSGLGVGLVIGLCFLIKSKMKNYRLRQQLKIAEKEIENLRAIPLQNR